jgi:membrane protease YdiL (CAAX protease family)
MRMKSGGSLKSYQRLLIFLLLILAITCVISPWMALGADWIHFNWPSLIDERVPFPRVFNRAFMVAGIIGFVAARKFIFPPRLKPLLLPGFRIAMHLASLGWILGVASTALLVSLMTIGDIFIPFFRLSWGESVSRLIGAFFAGMFAGSLEEIFFRGILFLGLRDDGRPVAAYMFANLFYSALHFVKPGEPYFLNGIEPLAGFRHLLTTFEPFFHPIDLLPGIFGLFLIGVILSYALVRTGNLYLSIGLHAGWVFGLKVIRVFGDFSRQDLGWIFGSTDPKIVSGVATWIGLLLVAVVVRQLTRHEQPSEVPGLS